MNTERFASLLKIRWMAGMLAVAAFATPLVAVADDTDIFLAAPDGSTTNPQVLIIVDNTSSNDASFSFTCPYSNLPSSTLLDMVYCALYGSIEAVRTQPALLGRLNIGLMSGGSGSNKGGSMYYPSTSPWNLPTMDATGITAFQQVIAAGIPKATGNAKLDGDMNEAWAFFTGHTGPSGTTYPPHIGNVSCRKNFIILIGAASKQGRPCNGSGCSSASDLASAGATAAQQVQLSTAALGANTGNDSSWIDEWARFMNQTDFNNNANDTQNITTYTIAAGGNAADYVQVLKSTGNQGGGKAFVGTDYTSMVQELLQAFEEIQSVNSVFASVALPVNVTNRAINDNQLFIGMFRPDAATLPRWFGNMKEYKLITSGSTVELGDSNGTSASNSNTGFITSCATSFFTNDSVATIGGVQTGYWQNTTFNPRPTGTCPTSVTNAYSDAPDGPFVEKGGIAEVIRRGNSSATNATPTWVVNRAIYTQSGSSLVAFNAANSGLAQSLVDFTSGKNTGNENPGFLTTTQTRPSLHGDVLHSRPTPVSYGGSNGTVLFYGSNDGTLRAAEVTPTTGSGRELWAFIAPEFFNARTHAEATPSSISPLQRLKDNDPVVRYPGITNPPASSAYRDYFFDGSIGLYQGAGVPPSAVWLYPTMRRGGRQVYALDATNPSSPSFKWKAGCPNLTDDTGCSSGLSGIGQTWSTPKVMRIAGYSTTSRVVLFGGGYDACEDANTATPACGSAKGNHVYVLDADTGAVIKTFDTLRSVAADVSILDIDGDGMIDHAYVADTGGNLYRIDFVDPGTAYPRTTRSSSAWSITRLGYTTGAGRKFLFAPALWAYTTQGQGKVYVAIGTGDREHPLKTQYPFTSIVNRFYMLVDDATTTPGSAANLDDASTFADFTAPTACDTPGALPSSTSRGWFMDLNAYGTGEQTVTSPLIVGGLIAFSTNRPIPVDAGSCGNLGEARGYWVNLFTGSGAIGAPSSCGGSRSSTFVGGGLPGSPVLVTVPLPAPNGGGNSITDIVIGATQLGGGTSTPISPQIAPVNASSTRKIIYWNMSTDR